VHFEARRSAEKAQADLDVKQPGATAAAWSRHQQKGEQGVYCSPAEEQASADLVEEGDSRF
jgi:hypothetical protein